MSFFVIDDEAHAELQPGTFTSFDEAVAELKRRAQIPWDHAPNVCPCRSWQTCGRDYAIVEYKLSGAAWQELTRVKALEVSAKGTTWSLA